jgi:hypothetical protein
LLVAVRVARCVNLVGELPSPTSFRGCAARREKDGKDGGHGAR